MAELTMARLWSQVVTLVGQWVQYRRTADLASTWSTVQEAIRNSLGPPLKALHAPIDIWLGSLPMYVAVASAVGLYVVALVWVWTLRTDFIFRGAPDERPWRDLRVWATIVILPYIAVYLLIGR